MTTYTKGLRESFKNISRETCHQRPPSGPKGQIQLTEKSGLIYWYMCNRFECDWKYIGEVCKDLHCRPPSAIYNHANTRSHPTRMDHVSIVGREAHNIAGRLSRPSI